jgi:Putative MetA-pathway of phenol degradation
MRLSSRILLLLVCAAFNAGPLFAQLPFYTDDPDVTDRGVLHFEFFNEYDALQSSQYPSLHQNTANFKLNYGLPHHLEIDLDGPYLSIYRAVGVQSSDGAGDLNMGLKWNFREATPGSHLPAFGSSFYVEIPTGNSRDQLGSGIADYWLNFIAQEPFSDKTRLTANLGFLFAGNTSTGDVGIKTTRGHVFTGGLSLIHDFSPRWTFGAEAYGGVADDPGLAKSQLQGMVGGIYTPRDGFSLTFAVLGGKYQASPRIGSQVGFALDIPNAFKSKR